ncbi:hypothetical protein [Flavisolibacter nicotianae]|uniref:hypothetical protein n=1 Tax=Flavisolibacter nicotianae TaxID=2364882 RepID=UPI000EB529A0|nr:hypothetical protein [Flavisolibacter nicotianae]
MHTVDIRGRELHLINRVLNRQQRREPFTIEGLRELITRHCWSDDFLANLERNGLLRFEDGRVYATDLAIRSINEKEKAESRLIEEHIIDDFEYAFLVFMNNRNEPVHDFDFPDNFKYHSKIDGQPIPGTANGFYDWMDEIHKYIDNPTIDGYVLNHTGRTRLEKLKRDKESKAENERLDIKIKRQAIANTKFSRNVTYISLCVAAITAFVPLIIWLADKDRTQKTSTEIPQLKQILQTQQQTQQNFQEIQKILQSLDTSVKRVKIEK